MKILVSLLKFYLRPIINNSELVRRTGDRPVSEAMMVYSNDACMPQWDIIVLSSVSGEVIEQEYAVGLVEHLSMCVRFDSETHETTLLDCTTGSAGVAIQ